MSSHSIPSSIDNRSLWSELTAMLAKRPADVAKKRHQWLHWLWIVAIYLVGLGIWIYFLDFGRFDWGIQDWVWAYRYGSAITSILESGLLPLNIEPPVIYATARYLAIPDYPLAPQFFLAGVLGIGPMYLLNTLLLYSVGFIGCLLIRRHFQLSILAFTAIAFLYSFNGFITSHLSVGHVLFAGYFFLPFFAYLIIRLFTHDIPEAWSAKMGLVLFSMLLHGAVRTFAACMLFMGILWLLAPRARRNLAYGILAGIVLNLYRFAPAAVELGSTTNVPFAGFVSVTHILKSLIEIVPISAAETGLPLAWWEFDMFIGIMGLVLVVVFGIYMTLIRNHRLPNQTAPDIIPIGYASIIFLILSTNYTFQVINRSPIPLVRLFHVPSRLLIVPLVIFILIAVIQFQKWLDERPLDTLRFAIVGGGLPFLVLDLIAHARIWRVALVNQTFKALPFEESFRVIARADPSYKLNLAISTAISAAALIYVLFVVWKKRGAANRNSAPQ